MHCKQLVVGGSIAPDAQHKVYPMMNTLDFLLSLLVGFFGFSEMVPEAD